MQQTINRNRINFIQLVKYLLQNYICHFLLKKKITQDQVKEITVSSNMALLVDII